MKITKLIKSGICVAVCMALASCSVNNTSINLPPIVARVKIDIKKDCGAKGDGVSNDTAAFQKASKMLEEKGGGTLVIPKGTYIVGEQFHEKGKYPYYQSARIFKVNGLNGLVIEGNKATVKLASGLRFGSFDKDSGEVYNPNGYFTDYKYRVGDTPIIVIADSENVLIRNLEIDGNLANLVLGGMWGDTGRQIQASGLRLSHNSDVLIDNVNSHHNALDGISISYGRLKEDDPATPHTLTDCGFEYNGRQGLSWVGGRGVKAYRCKFNHTGKGHNNGKPLHSAPGAGLDIEAENSITRDGYFENCEFIGNTGAGMVADSGDGGHATFKNCVFWGTTNWSIWSKKPALKYIDCEIYGSAVNAVGSPDPKMATQWINCTFEDKPWTNGKVYRANSTKFLLEVNGNMENVLLKNCAFIANTCCSIWASARENARVTFDSCVITHKKADLKDHSFQGLFKNANFIGTHFTEEFAPEVTSKWYLNVNHAQIAAEPPTIVDGPHVRWRSWKGKVGVVPETSLPALAK